MSEQPPAELKLIALDAEDLGILSAHLQDAVLRVGDLAYLPGERRFAALLNRFDWVMAERGKTPDSQARPGSLLRRRAALRFERVSAARVSGITLSDKARALSLLALQFETTAAPAGHVTLIFAGGAAIRLDVECVEAELRDLDAAWAARSAPVHPEVEPESKS